MNIKNEKERNIKIAKYISILSLTAISSLLNISYAQDIKYQKPSNVVDAPVPVSEVHSSNTVGVIGAGNNGVIAPNGQLVVEKAPSSMPSSYGLNNGNNKPQDELVELMNYSPAEIREALSEMDKRRRATKERSQSKAVQSSVNVFITPGSSVPVLRTAANRNSSLVVVDQAGNPWPIENFSLGAAKDFSVKRLDSSAKEKGFMLDISPTENYVSGNLTLKLEGLNTPVVVEMIAGQTEYDAPLLFKIMSAGPNTKYTSVSLPEKEDPHLASVLQGVAPNGLKQLTVDSGLAQAWLSNDGKTMYIRSKLRLMPFEHMTASPDGTFAYRVKKLPVLTYKYEDKFGQIKINGI